MTSDPLLRLPLFQNLPDGAIQAILSRSQQITYPDQEMLCAEGQPVDCVHILLEGTVEIIRFLGTREQHVLAVRYAGDTLGEMNLFAAQQVRTASVRALGQVRTLKITLADMEALVRQFPQIAFRFMYEISERMRDSENQLITHLSRRNLELEQALVELQMAQAQIVAKEKLEHELTMARGIQQSLLPKQIPSLPGWQLHAVWEPARAVSGDFYDFITFPDGKLGLIIGDVTGKGVPAALVMAISRSVLRAVTGGIQETQLSSPGEILSQVNQILHLDMPQFMFVTCLLVIIDLHTGDFTFANAGHVLPTQIHARGLHELKATGLPLGLFPGLVYDTFSAQAAPGDCLFFLSDGLVEAHNPQGQMFGSQRLKDQLLQHAADPAADGQALIERLQRALQSFTGAGWEQEDDLTFVTLTRAGQPDP
jgi:serine phosphatase RsbU (regulator of sigma subunit)